MNVTFDHDYQHKVMQQAFGERTELRRPADVLMWRSQWTQALSSWHSPYKCLVDCENLVVLDETGVEEALSRLIRFLEGFFLRKVAGFGLDEEQGHQRLPFPVFSTEEEARAHLGIRTKGAVREPGDLRSQIELENHFNQHVVELTFKGPVALSTNADMAILKSKLTNNLMQWHSAWSLLVDCSNLEMSGDLSEEWEKMERYFQGFFLKKVVGYGTRSELPFATFRARHQATARLESEGAMSGAAADCQSRKAGPS